MLARLPLLVVLVLGCAGPGEAFPPTEAAAQRMVDAQTRGPLQEERAPSAEDLARAVDRGPLVVGWEAIAAALDAHPRVVFGVHHDARGQHRAFHRLFGPTGRPRALALELFDARGTWGGVSAEAQAGDAAVLAAYARAGGERLGPVRERLVLGAYTAWKYDLIDDVLGWVVAARGAEQRILGCDAPPAILARMERFSEPVRLRLRELHCARALETLGQSPYAALYGDAHALAQGLPRFLDRATRVHAIGGRASEAGVEPALATRVRVADPTLARLGPRRFALLLPGPRLGLARDRSRGEVDAPGVFFDSPAVATLDGEAIAPGATVPAGDHALVLRSAGTRYVVGISAPEGARVRVDATLEVPRVDVRSSRPSGAGRL